MNKINRSEIFKKAHELVHYTNSIADSYQVTFAECLKLYYDDQRNDPVNRPKVGGELI